PPEEEREQHERQRGRRGLERPDAARADLAIDHVDRDLLVAQDRIRQREEHDRDERELHELDAAEHELVHGVAEPDVDDRDEHHRRERGDREHAEASNDALERRHARYRYRAASACTRAKNSRAGNPSASAAASRRSIISAAASVKRARSAGESSMISTPPSCM